jgi:hypothetical protein
MEALSPSLGGSASDMAMLSYQHGPCLQAQIAPPVEALTSTKRKVAQTR